ncbi:hypothetical protein PENTCL1PPCAC_13841, partial [Pristionchus entomophagus]
KKLIHMHAIIPSEFANIVGLGKWLTVHQRFQEAIEVACAPQKIVLSDAWESIMKYLVKFVIMCSVLSAIMMSPLLLIIIIFIFLILAFAGLIDMIWPHLGDVDKSRRIARFLTCFSQIQTLVLFYEKPIRERVPHAIESSLGCLSVQRLELWEWKCDENDMQLIIRLTRKHRIQYIFIFAQR